jgi:sarcosine oxidase delta subunit
MTKPTDAQQVDGDCDCMGRGAAERPAEYGELIAEARAHFAHYRDRVVMGKRQVLALADALESASAENAVLKQRAVWWVIQHAPFDEDGFVSEAQITALDPVGDASMWMAEEEWVKLPELETRLAAAEAELARLRAAIAAVEEEFADYKHIREQPGQGIGYDRHLRHCDRPQAHRDDEVWNEQRAALSVAEAPEAKVG